MPWSALGAMGSSLNNAYSQHKTNESSMEIAQMNNEFNEEMLQKQMDYNTEMWNKNNEYNTPANQVKRLREAGLNPALVLGNVAGGQVSSSAPSSGTASAAQNPHLQAPTVDLSQTIDAMRLRMEERIADAQVKKLEEDARTAWINNQSLADIRTAELAKLAASTENEKEKTFYQRKLNQWADSQMSAEYQRTLAETDSLENQARNSLAQAVSLEISNKYLPEILRNQISKQVVDIALATAQEQLTYAQYKHEIEKSLETIARAEGFVLDNKVKSETVDDLVEQVKTMNFYFGRERHYTGLAASLTGDAAKELIPLLLKGKVPTIKGFGK